VFTTSITLVVEALDVSWREAADVLESMDPLPGGMMSSAVPANAGVRNHAYQIHTHHAICSSRFRLQHEPLEDGLLSIAGKQYST